MLTVIANPIAGHRRGAQKAQQVTQWLDQHGYAYKLERSYYAKHAITLAREVAQQGCERILAVGGDGTLNEVVNGARGYDCTFALIPAGSGNDFAASAALPEDFDQLMNAAVNAPGHRVDVLEVNDYWVLNVMGAGFDVDVLLRRASINKSFPWSSVSYYIALIVTLLRFRFHPMKITIDDNPAMEGEFMLVAVGNGRTYGSGMPVTPKAVIDDGWMDVCVVRKLSKWKIPPLLIEFLRGRHIRHDRYVHYQKAKSVNLEAEYMPINIDGDIIGTTPCQVHIVPAAVSVVMGTDCQTMPS